MPVNLAAFEGCKTKDVADDCQGLALGGLLGRANSLIFAALVVEGEKFHRPAVDTALFIDSSRHRLTP